MNIVSRDSQGGVNTTEYLQNYWGKSRNSNSLGLISAELWHPILCHSLDAAAVAKAWLDSADAIRRTLGLLGKGRDGYAGWVLFYTFLHDYGKINARFQSLNAPLWQILQSPREKRDYARELTYGNYRHGEEGPRLLQEDFPDEFVSSWMVDAGGHHDRPSIVGRERISISPIGPLKNRDHQARKEFFETGRRLFLLEGQTAFPDKAPSPAFKGFCCVCDWLASNVDFFPFHPGTDLDAQTYFDEALVKAKSTLKACGLLGIPSRESGMKHIYPKLRKPTPIQTVKSPFPPETGGILAIIEAPTGSGKTEAAISMASEWIASGESDGLSFALPTQATANAMFDRIEPVSRVLFTGRSQVVLAHGKSENNSTFQKLIENGKKDGGTLGNESAAECSHWLAESRKRAFLGQISVSTIDQVLLGSLPVRHASVRVFGIGKNVLIVDEVHAYSSYMNRLLDDILERQKNSGGNVILLSATLPEKRRKKILEAWTGKPDLNLSKTYPLVSFAAEEIREVPPKVPSPCRKVVFETTRTSDSLPDDPLLERIVQEGGKGKAVGVMCNTVANAQEVFRKLCSIAPDELPIDLFHARYTFRDRDNIEQRVMRLYGKERTPGKGRVLVSTQVVEQSLDLDFDFLVTQVCPADVLFQRIGRLHRHASLRTDINLPCCVVLCPEEDEFGVHEKIYGSRSLLWRTRALLEEQSVPLLFPEAYRSWVDSVYNDDFEGEPGNIAACHFEWKKNQENSELLAETIKRMNLETLTDESAAITGLTRDSDMSLSVLPICLDDGGQYRLLDEQSTPIDIDGPSGEEVQLQVLHCPSSWRGVFKGLEKTREMMILLPVKGTASEWVSEQGLHYSTEMGLWKEMTG